MIEASDFISTRKEVLHPSYGKGVEVTVRQSLSWTTFVSDRTLQTVDHAGCKNALSMTEGNLMRGIKHEIYGEVIDVLHEILKEVHLLAMDYPAPGDAHDAIINSAELLLKKLK